MYDHLEAVVRRALSSLFYNIFLVGSRETVLKSVTESYRWASMDSSAQRNVTVGRPEDKRLRTKISRKAEALDTDVYVSLR